MKMIMRFSANSMRTLITIMHFGQAIIGYHLHFENLSNLHQYQSMIGVISVMFCKWKNIKVSKRSIDTSYTTIQYALQLSCAHAVCSKTASRRPIRRRRKYIALPEREKIDLIFSFWEIHLPDLPNRNDDERRSRRWSMRNLGQERLSLGTWTRM